MDERNKHGWAFWLTVTLIAMPLLYGVLYLLTLKGKVYFPIASAVLAGQNIYKIEPRYRISEGWFDIGMRPAHWIDRRLRSDYWQTIEHSGGRKWKNPKPAANPAVSTRVSPASS